MKKNYLFLLALLSGLVLTGCGNDAPDSSSIDSTTSIEISTETSSDESSESSEIVSTYIPDDCTPIGIARLGEDEAQFDIYGVIAQFTYGYDGKEAFYLVDDTGSILVYADGFDISTFDIGYTVKASGSIDHYQSEQEAGVGNEIGYHGALQLVASTIELIYDSKDEIKLDSIEDTTINEIATTNFRENDLTSKLFRVNSTIVKNEQTGFTKYYFFDLSMDESVYCYSKMSGSDFGWLDEYDGQSREVIIAIHSLRPRDEAWRIIPVQILDEVVLTDEDNVKFALDRLDNQFLPSYYGDRKIELLPYDEKLGEEGVVTYTSSSTVHSVTKEDNIDYLNIDGSSLGTFTITISLTYKNISQTRDVVIEVIDEPEYETTPISEVLAMDEGETVIVSGIYLKYTANAQGIYIADSTGILTVYYAGLDLEDYQEGETLVFEGTITKDFKIEGTYDGYNRLANATLLSSDGIVKDWDKSIVTGDTTISDLYNNFTIDMIGKIYRASGQIKVNETPYYSNIQIVDPDTGTYMSLYCSSASQLEWLFEYQGITQDYYIYIRDSKSGSTARIEIIDIA